MSEQNINIGSPFKLTSHIEIKNRIFKSAMSEQLGDKHHNPRPELITLYRKWAKGGAGILVTGNIMTDRTALGEPGNVVLDAKSNLDLFKKWAEAGRTHQCHIWAQLNHPGKQSPSFLSEKPVAPSDIPLGKGFEKSFNKPRSLSDSEILDIINKFAQSAVLAKEAGFTGVQIHGAHGYLISQFLSPRHNQRRDRWGGNFENRARFVCEIYKKIREKTGPTFPIGIKLNSADFMKDGFSETESMDVIKILSELGIDQIEISGGTYEQPAMIGDSKKASTLKREAYFLKYAEELRKHVKTPLVVTGGFRSANAMNQALTDSATDFIGLARPMTLDPDFPNKLMENPETNMKLPKLTTGFSFIDKLSMLNITWYEQQIFRISQNKNPSPELSTWLTFFKTLSQFGLYSFKKRRA